VPEPQNELCGEVVRGRKPSMRWRSTPSGSRTRMVGVQFAPNLSINSGCSRTLIRTGTNVSRISRSTLASG
jgi:hypothetical protein